MEQNIDYKYVQELLVWAQNILDLNSCPSGSFQLNKSTTVLDCEKFLESMIPMVSHNWENPTFYPIAYQLQEFREKLTEQDINTKG